MKRISLIAFLSLLLPLSALWAYQGGAVKDGGTISGVVKFKGAAPAPKKLEVTKDKEVCAKTAKSDASLIVSGGNLVNAVVSITDIKTGKKMEPQKVTLDQKVCEYHPHVLAFPAGSTLEIQNPDGILHNVHSYSKVNTPFNIAQPKFKKTVSVKIEKPEVISLKCDVHGWMSGWLFVAENPYFSLTDKSGSFKLTDVPPGTYTLEVWHETLGKQTQKVTVKPKEEAKVTFEMAKK
jgi:plastocyanin